MNKNQSLEILERISLFYQNFEINEMKIDVWTEFLESMPYEGVMARLKKHIAEQKFPPTIAEVAVKETPTNAFLEKTKQWEEAVNAERHRKQRS